MFDDENNAREVGLITHLGSLQPFIVLAKHKKGDGQFSIKDSGAAMYWFLVIVKRDLGIFIELGDEVMDDIC